VFAGSVAAISALLKESIFNAAPFSRMTGAAFAGSNPEPFRVTWFFW
jgi:hypothetical protein